MFCVTHKKLLYSVDPETILGHIRIALAFYIVIVPAFYFIPMKTGANEKLC